MEPQVLYRVCYGTSTPNSFQKSLLSFRPALLHQHRRHRVLHHDYPAVIPQQSSSVRGTYVSGLTDGDIYRLDIFEGNEYERRRVKLKILDTEGDEAGEGNVEGEELEVETYIWVAGEERLVDGEWDFAEFRREKMHNWITSSDEYDEVDEAVRTHGNDPTGGRGLNGSISDKLEGTKDKVLKSAV
ncbi:MAG: hypothetical protein LQ339_007612 [Xanthoria mediterranea]|nr:MAG: hypothetical protein LQ339_007612 [Xanthoria mediterranea]